MANTSPSFSKRFVRFADTQDYGEEKQAVLKALLNALPMRVGCMIEVAKAPASTTNLFC